VDPCGRQVLGAPEDELGVRGDLLQGLQQRDRAAAAGLPGRLAVGLLQGAPGGGIGGTVGRTAEPWHCSRSGSDPGTILIDSLARASGMSTLEAPATLVVSMPMADAVVQELPVTMPTTAQIVPAMFQVPISAPTAKRMKIALMAVVTPPTVASRTAATV
jgi:hypothetical protein